jgi:hypothetical protein
LVVVRNTDQQGAVCHRLSAARGMARTNDVTSKDSRGYIRGEHRRVGTALLQAESTRNLALRGGMIGWVAMS